MSNPMVDLISAADEFRKRLNRQLIDQFGLTYAQYNVVQSIHKRGGTSTARLIAQDTQTTLTNVQTMANRLEYTGWISRTHDCAGDKRFVTINLVRPVEAIMTFVAEQRLIG